MLLNPTCHQILFDILSILTPKWYFIFLKVEFTIYRFACYNFENLKKGLILMLELQIQNNQIVITSLQVANAFHKSHRHVLEDIRATKERIISCQNRANVSADLDISSENQCQNRDKLLADFDISPEKMFFDTVIRDSRNRARKIIAMNRLGFRALVDGYIGDVAFAVKLSLDLAFESKYNELRQLEILKTRENDMIALGINEGIAKLASFEQTSLEFGADFRLPAYKEPDNLLNPTQISLILWNEKHPRLINRILEEMDFQENIGGKWIAKGNGILYSERIPFNHNGHAELQLRWKSSIIEVIRPFLEKNDVEKSISPPKNNEEMLNVTQIAKILELSASEINQILRQMKYQRRFRKIWIPIGDGLRYIGTNRKWKTPVIELIRSFLQERKDE